MSENKRMPKTARPKKVVIGDEAFDKCPYPGCDFMSRDWGYDPRSGLRMEMLGPGEMTEHIRKPHHLVWMRIGKNVGWWDARMFQSRPD